MPNSLIFKSQSVHSWDQLLKSFGKMRAGWVFRGQVNDDPLMSTLERNCKDSAIPNNEWSSVESEIIRDFQRRYSGDDHDAVLEDTLYCLALMRHHGAPTRLLDWSYSPFIAAYFALENKPGKNKTSVIWCLNESWCGREAERIAGSDKIKARNDDQFRKDRSFDALYRTLPFNTFVFLENPFLLNARLMVQQGVFLCSGNISKSLVANLKAMQGWNLPTAIIKIQLKLNKTQRLDALDELARMGISHASLYPGLDGFARSYNTRMRFFSCQAIKRKKAMAET